MKTTVERRSDARFLVHVKVPAEVVDRKLDEVYRRVVRHLEVPGFRKGRIPRSYLEMRFGEDFLYEDAQQELLEEYLPQALDEHDLTPATRPELQDLGFKAGQPFEFNVEVEVFPEVKLPDLAKIEVEEPAKKRVTKKDVEGLLEELRYQHATLVPRGDAAAIEDEDVVVIRHEDGETREIQAQAGGWTSALIGRKAGDEVQLRPTADETLTVKIDGVKRIELPELEELAATLGHDDVEALQNAVRKELKERAELDRERRVRMIALDAVVEASGVVIPTRVVEETLEQEIAYLKRQGHEPSEDEESEMREEIERRFKRERVLQAIKEVEEISLDDEEFESYLEEEAERREMNPVKFQALLEREGQLEQLHRERESRKALDLLVEKVEFVKSQGDAQHNDEDDEKERTQE